MGKVFGGVNLTWKKLIIFAIIAGVVTAAIALIPALEHTSFHAIAETFEVWIFIGIFIIMNSKSNKDSALKCFIFFLISQPLVYLIQVPFSDMGFGLFTYYKYWAIWTVLCLPMGYIGYYMKKEKWWGFAILFPMLALTAYSLYDDFRQFMYYRPFYLLITVFCIAMMIVYPLGIFKDKKIKLVGTIISAVMTVGVLAFSIMNPMVYATDVLSDDVIKFDDTYSVYLEEPGYGDIYIQEWDGFYTVHAEFKRAGETNFALESPKGEEHVYHVKWTTNTFEIEEVK